MKKYYWLIFLFFCFLPITHAEENTVNIYFFHSSTCSHCKKEGEFLKSLEKNYSYIKVYRYEVHQEENQEAIQALEKIYSFTLESVPITIIGNSMVSGFQEEKTTKEMKQLISYYRTYGYQDKLGSSLHIKTLPTREESASDPSLEKYFHQIDDKVLGLISVKDLDNYTASSLLGLFSTFNPFFLLSYLSLFFLIPKYPTRSKKMLGVLLYFLFLFLGNLFLLKSQLLPYLIITLITSCFLFLLSHHHHQKNPFLTPVILSLSFLATILNQGNQNLQFFQNLYKIYQPLGWEKLLYDGCYFVPILLMYSFCFCLYFILEKEKPKYPAKHQA